MNELFLNIFFAFIGGIVMNFMPCILPLISLKISSFLGNFSNRKLYILKNSCYIAGIISFFIILALSIIILKVAGHKIMFGEHMQSANFLLIIFTILMLIGFNLSGLYEVNLDVSDSSKLLSRFSGLFNNYLNGILASILAIPCTAPFIATAFTYAITTTNLNLFLITFAMGTGFAFPFILAIFLPSKILNFMPKPGAWMEKFKELMAFPIYASAMWILFVLIKQNQYQYIAAALFIALIVYFILWFQKNFHFKTIYKILIYGTIILGSYFIFPNAIDQDFTKKDFSYVTLESALKKHKKVFVVASASWCLTCQVNEKNALSSQEFKDLMIAKDITYLYADFTNLNLDGKKFLEKYNQIGIPFYILFDSHGKEEILPQLLSSEFILQKLHELK